MKRLVIVFFALLSVGRAAQPTIFRMLDPVRPDQTLLLFGAGMTPAIEAEGFRVADDFVEAPPLSPGRPEGRPRTMKVLQATELSAKVLIPASWKPGIYALRLKNDGNDSQWLLANRPVVWWCRSEEADFAFPGGVFRAFGQNFDARTRAWLVTGKKSRRLKITFGRENDFEARVPDDLPPGDYQLYVHNGWGSECGFSDPIAVRVEEKPALHAQKFDVRKFGAKGDNRTDDTAAFVAALAAAEKAGGGIVFLSPGAYLVSRKLVVPAGVTVRGESTDDVWIKNPPDAPTFEALFAGSGNFALENFSVLSRSARRIVASPDIEGTYRTQRPAWGAADAGTGHIRLSGLRIRHLLPADKKKAE
ncbi:MAG: glycosyl hydrolase family 28-related protein, partial [Chthoniobacterales bacterium]